MGRLVSGILNLALDLAVPLVAAMDFPQCRLYAGKMSLAPGGGTDIRDIQISLNILNSWLKLMFSL